MKTKTLLVVLLLVLALAVAGSSVAARDGGELTNCGAGPTGPAPGGVGPPPVVQVWSQSADCSGPYILR